MAAVVRYVFACCLRDRSQSPSVPDERTPFIQPTDEVPPVRNYTVDHQKMKSRLGEIVRSKEGKMVNVNQPLPFNLHNRPIYGRSLSTNTTPPRPTSSASPDSPPQSAYPYQPSAALGGASSSRDPSPSIQTSRSTSSLHPGDASYLPPEADPDGRTRRPILNVRLVRGPGGFLPGARLRQGRSTTRGRLGRFGEERGEGAEPGTGAGVHDKGKNAELAVRSSSSSSPPRETSLESLGVGPVENGHELSSSTGGGNRTRVAPDRKLAFLASEFKIEDVGSISQSWGE